MFRGVFRAVQYSKPSYSLYRKSKGFIHNPPKDTQHSFNYYQMTIYSALLIMGNAISLDTADANQTKGKKKGKIPSSLLIAKREIL